MRRLFVFVIAAAALWPSTSGATSLNDVNFEAHLDLVAISRPDQDQVNYLNYGENPFHTARVRIFFDAPIQEHVHAFTEFVYDDGTSRPRLFGGFVRLSDPKGRDLHLEAGKIPLHIGSFPNRGYAPQNNLIGAPLMYQYHNDLRDDQIPVRNEDIVQNQGRGYYTSYTNGGLTGFGGYGGRTMTTLYENCWDFGAAAVGTIAPFEFSAAVTNGTVGDPVMGYDTNAGKQVLARIGFVPFPWIRAGVSGARGPYLYDELEDDLPPGREVEDFNQLVGAADLELSYGHGVIYSEYAYSRYESPFVGNLDLRTWYVEGKWTVIPGWYVAGRYDRMLFNDVPLQSGALAGWDADVWKREIGIGFKPSKRLVAKLVHQESKIAVNPPLVHAFAAAQLSVVF